MRKGTFIVSFGLLFFASTALSIFAIVCPQRSGAHNEQTTGCPNLFKSQWTTMYWWQLEIEGKTYGRGQCGGGRQCWPAFHTPTKKPAGSNSTYDYSFWVHQDRNHNGFSEPNELQSLSVAAIRAIDLKFKESRHNDANGNWFRYRAKVTDASGAQAGRWAWDVFVQKPD